MTESYIKEKKRTNKRKEKQGTADIQIHNTISQYSKSLQTFKILSLDIFDKISICINGNER